MNHLLASFLKEALKSKFIVFVTFFHCTCLELALHHLCLVFRMTFQYLEQNESKCRSFYFSANVLGIEY